MINELSREFETVRIVKCNDLDLSLFQFDYDLTFAVFFLYADKTIYARYGTRTGKDADKDVALEGLAATMTEVLKLHKSYPDNRPELKGKQALATEYRTPHAYPHLDHFKPTLDYDGAVAKSCIHCHQVREAQRLVFRSASKPLPQKLMFPFPNPNTLGLVFDKQTTTGIALVTPDSIAEGANLESGDKILSIEGSSVASEADVFWMLHNLEQQTELNLVVVRSGQSMEVKMKLPEGWRKRSDIAWRPTSWEFRRMATGGLTLKPISNEARKELSIDESKMALRATHVGMYHAHARARRAGIKKNDIVIAFDGQTHLLTETMVNEYAVQLKKPGDSVEIKYLREGEERTARIKLQ